jgi:alpha-methylacyl-CoA racemase
MQPLAGLQVLDFSTLTPGPLATLILAEAGAEVVKIERPDGGDALRAYPPVLGVDGAAFSLLNRGKRSVAIDLKAEGVLDRLRSLIEHADVLVEQFRPGVMERLGLGYDALASINPRLIYCSITGYGQEGPKAARAGHDLNYLAETGLLALGADGDGAPTVPPTLIADFAGGSYPAVINILLALREREATGRGCHLDIAMADGMYSLMVMALAAGFTTGSWPRPGGDLLTGGSPRYRIYRTSDGRHLAVAALEERFWQRFCALIALESEHRNDRRNPAATERRIAQVIGARPAAYWSALLDGHDVCCAIVATPEQAVADPHVDARGLFAPRLSTADGTSIPALPVPLDARFRSTDERAAPALGEATDLLGGES